MLDPITNVNKVSHIMPVTNQPAKLWFALCLRCPHCGKTRLLKPKSFVTFAIGCEPCQYRYEREVGYFSGASWMMNYAFATLMAMSAGGYMVWKHSNAGDFIVAGVPALFGGVSAFLFIPFGRSLWLWLDHKLHPLTEADHISKPLAPH